MRSSIHRQCATCGAANLDKNTLGINKKLLGEKTKVFYCLDCLAEYLGTNTQAILDKIEDFKDEGCTMFE